MKRGVLLSMAAMSTLFASDSINLPQVNVEEKINNKVVKDVSGEELKSADLAEALTKQVPSISLVRRSGIANDVILRGAKKDNINILIDEGKIYGACPNRMDPATSHVMTNNIESVEVIEGPYDVENFGTLSGVVKVTTKEPKKGFGGEVNLNVGSFGYKKVSATVNAGWERFKFLISASTEDGDAYEDGDGDDFKAQQIKHNVPTNNQYKDSAKNHEAFKKQTLMSKATFNIDDSSEVKLGYTLNRSDRVLYPNTPMDAKYDDSDLYSLKYDKRDLGRFSKELNFESYYSKVDHPMDARLRNMDMGGMTNHLKTSIWGLKLKNAFEINEDLLTLGLDTSERNWKGKKFNDSKTVDFDSLPSTDTTNKALFAKYEKSFGALDLEFGARYDNTDIETDDNSRRERDFNTFNGNVFAVYNLTKETKFFAGMGTSSRVPDARELHYKSTASVHSGNDDLEETRNKEIDLGIEQIFGDFRYKTKLFYSDLDDYIYNVNGTTFENIDAKIYGLEFSGDYLINDEFSLDFGAAYLRGKKDDALNGQSDTDLAEIPPLKGNIALTYEEAKVRVRAEVVAAKSWNNYDEDNGEQDLGGYAVFNLKYDYDINRNFDFTLGIDNVFDTTYATTNTYNDIKYIGNGNTELVNDPGRYVYVNLRYKF
jgi:iron complex outermembrane receptor protein